MQTTCKFFNKNLEFLHIYSILVQDFAPHIKIQGYGILFVLVILNLINYDLEFCSTNSHKLIYD